MKVVKELVFIAATLILVGCNQGEVNALKEQNNALKEQNAQLQRKIDDMALAMAAKEEEQSTKEAEAARQSTTLKKEVLAIAKQMAAKEYDCAGLFYSSDGNLLKRNGYDQDIKQPSIDVAHYVGLFKSVLASCPKAEKQPSLIRFNEIVQKWADQKKEIMQLNARAIAAINNSISFGATLKEKGVEALEATKKLRSSYEEEFFKNVEALLN